MICPAYRVRSGLPVVDLDPPRLGRIILLLRRLPLFHINPSSLTCPQPSLVLPLPHTLSLLSSLPSLPLKRSHTLLTTHTPFDPEPYHRKPHARTRPIPFILLSSSLVYPSTSARPHLAPSRFGSLGSPSSIDTDDRSSLFEDNRGRGFPGQTYRGTKT